MRKEYIFLINCLKATTWSHEGENLDLYSIKESNVYSGIHCDYTCPRNNENAFYNLSKFETYESPRGLRMKSLPLNAFTYAFSPHRELHSRLD